MHSKLKTNIWKLYVISMINNFLLIMPIVVLFYKSNGLSMKDVLLLQAIFSIVVIILEVPTGYIADKIGRRFSIIVASVSLFIGFTIYSKATGFISFLVAEMVLGFANSFLSGADSALIYDSLIELNETEKYSKYEGKMSFVATFSEATASILGGLLALVSLRTPFYVEAVISLIAIPVAFSLIDVNINKKEKKKIKTDNMFGIVKYSFTNKKLRYLILYSSVISSSTLVLVWFIQPYMKMVGIPIALFGFIWAIFYYLNSFFAITAHSYKNFL